MEYFKAETPVSRHFNDIYKDLSGCFPVHVVLESTEEDFFERPDNVAHITRLQAFLGSLPKVDKSISFADYMMLINYATNRYESQYYQLPEESFEVRMLINNYKMLLGQDMLTAFMSPDFSKANILLLTHLSSSREFLDIREKILAHSKTTFPAHLSVHVAGVAHELNQPLNAIKMGSDYLKIMLQEGNRIEIQHLSGVVYEIDTQVDRASEIINRLRVFEPFFTTKQTGKGKGRGMSIVNEIVRDYDGRIKIESKKEIGTTVVLSFPISGPL